MLTLRLGIQITCYLRTLGSWDILLGIFVLPKIDWDACCVLFELSLYWVYFSCIWQQIFVFCGLNCKNVIYFLLDKFQGRKWVEIIILIFFNIKIQNNFKQCNSIFSMPNEENLTFVLEGKSERQRQRRDGDAALSGYIMYLCRAYKCITCEFSLNYH